MLIPFAILAGEFQISDIFGRPLETRAITLVDWEGHIANPVIEIFVTAPVEAAPFPTTATLSANGARIYFDNPSRAGPGGPSKVLTFQNATSSVPVRISIFPDRDGADEDYTLMLRLNSAVFSNSFALHVIDQDRAQPPEFSVKVDFSHDLSGFFDDPRKCAIVEQAAADWAYFISDMQLDTVPAGAESTYLWAADDSCRGLWAANKDAYHGFLFYARGIHSAALQSSGGASDFSFQSSQNAGMTLRRSGSCMIETTGNYNSLGWFLTQSDDDWCVSGNQIVEPNDFYSIALHEIGHALFFSPAHPRFGEYRARGKLDASHAAEYHGNPPLLDEENHFVRTVDRASGCGAFGSEYLGDVPRGRWLITKLDLLAAQALGYRLRQTSALLPIEWAGDSLPQAALGEPYLFRLSVKGGIPSCDFSISEKALPAGLMLDRFTGVISGTPTALGATRFAVRVRDQDVAGVGVTTNFILVVASPLTLAAGAERGGRSQLSAPPPVLFMMNERTDKRTPLVTVPMSRLSHP